MCKPIDERNFCLGDDCPQKYCEICPAKRTTQMDPTDSFRSQNKRGFYTSGLVEITDSKTGEKRLAYARNGD